MPQSFSLLYVTYNIFPRHVYVTIAPVFIETAYNKLRYFICVTQFPEVVYYVNHVNWETLNIERIKQRVYVASIKRISVDHIYGKFPTSLSTLWPGVLQVRSI